MRRLALIIVVILAGFLAQATQAQTPNTINTIAGGGTNSGAATTAVLPRPFSAVRDTLGNTFIAVPVRSQIVIKSPAAPSPLMPEPVSRVFPVTVAPPLPPRSIFLGARAGCCRQLYLRPINNRIRRVDATTHVITTVAGSGDPFFGNFGGDGGPATNAFLNIPSPSR